MSSWVLGPLLGLCLLLLLHDCSRLDQESGIPTSISRKIQGDDDDGDDDDGRFSLWM
jgi:hypothetical protein